MVDGPRALQSALGGRLVEEIDAAALGATRLPASSTLLGRLELERLEQSLARVGGRRVGADAVEALQRDLLRHFGVIGDQRLVIDVDDEQLVDQALGVGEVDRG